MTTSIDMQAVADLLLEVGRDIVMPRFRRLRAEDVVEKTSHKDLVTVADEEAEAFLAPRLEALMPGSRTVGEEAVGRNPSLMGRLREPGLSWLIDPIDGTASFAVGSPFFATMVALVRDGDAVASWILDPPTGRLYMAEKGAGAWLREPDGSLHRLRMPSPPSLAHLSGVANFGISDRELARRMAYRIDRTAGMLNLRCSGQEYPAMALGQIHWGIYGRNIPWDHAPGTLLICEAGGIARRLNGQDYRAADPPGGSPLVAACGEGQWNWLKTGIFDP